MTGWRAALAATAALCLAPAAPAAAQITCRPNALGAEVCVGLPPPSLRGGQPYEPRRRGLAGVQPRPGAEGGPSLVPARRTDRLGGLFLDAADLPPRRPPLPGVAPVRNCRRDALGNLVCG